MFRPRKVLAGARRRMQGVPRGVATEEPDGVRAVPLMRESRLEAHPVPGVPGAEAG